MPGFETAIPGFWVSSLTTTTLIQQDLLYENMKVLYKTVFLDTFRQSPRREVSEGWSSDVKLV